MTEVENDSNAKDKSRRKDAIALFLITLILCNYYFKLFSINGDLIDLILIEYIYPFIVIIASSVIVILFDLKMDRLRIFPLFEYEHIKPEIPFWKAFFWFPIFVAGIYPILGYFYYEQFNSHENDSIEKNYNYIQSPLTEFLEKQQAISPNVVKEEIVHNINLFPKGEKEYFKALFYFYPFVKDCQSENDIFPDNSNFCDTSKIYNIIIKGIEKDYTPEMLLSDDKILELNINLWGLYQKAYLNKEQLPILATYWDKYDPVTNGENSLLWKITAIEALKQEKALPTKVIHGLYENLLKVSTDASLTGNIYPTLLAQVLLSVSPPKQTQAMEDADIFSVINPLLEQQDFKKYLINCSKNNINCKHLLEY